MKRQKYLLDTYICAYILRGKYDLNERVKAIGGLENCCISEVTIAELKFGKILRQLIGGPKYVEQHMELLIEAVQVLHIEPYFDVYADERARLELVGTPSHDDFDLLIGCTAVAENMVMVTQNVKDFKNIKGIKIENWIPEQ